MKEAKITPLTSEEQKDINENKLVAAIGYIWILCLVPLLLKKNSKFCQFHAKQGLVLFIIELLGMIPFVGWVLFIAAVIYSVYGIVQALDGKYWEAPIIGEYAKKINL